MPVVYQQRDVIDRPKWAIQGVMDDVIQHPDSAHALPAEWLDNLKFGLMISSDLMDLDALSEAHLAAFGRIISRIIRDYVNGNTIHDERYQEVYLQTLRAIQDGISRTCEPKLPCE